MQAGYFKTAWNDIKNSPGWKGKVFLLALITTGCSLVPIIGPIFAVVVLNGYLYGWARDAAWGIQGPLPQRIFGNEDGKLYSRGFFISVLAFVLALIPGVLYAFYWIFLGGGALGWIVDGGHGSYGSSVGSVMAAGLGGMIFYLLYMVALFAVNFFTWVGSMRISIYGRLSAGFQFKKIWAMIRHDTGGILRIFGMSLLMGLIVGAVFIFVFSLVFGLVIVLALSMSGGTVDPAYSSYDGAFVGLILSVIGVAIVVVLVATYFLVAASVWMDMMICRALGYWVRQFDVPSWRGQDDPMPFELQQAASATTGGGQYAQGYGQTPPSAGQPVQPPVGQPVSQTPPQGQAVPTPVQQAATVEQPQQAPEAPVAQSETAPVQPQEPTASAQDESAEKE